MVRRVAVFIMRQNTPTAGKFAKSPAPDARWPNYFGGGKFGGRKFWGCDTRGGMRQCARPARGARVGSRRSAAPALDTSTAHPPGRPATTRGATWPPRCRDRTAGSGLAALDTTRAPPARPHRAEHRGDHERDQAAHEAIQRRAAFTGTLARPAPALRTTRARSPVAGLLFARC